MTGPTSYDTVPYPTGSYPQTHPDRLATIATLFGMSPAPVDRCRVLELGCGNGGNVIPMAYALPNSTFVGIDLASTAIDAGRAVVDRLALRNITLLPKDLRTLPADFGTFDYIIAHGLYAWVSPPVQDWILAVCRSHLAPQGVAFVSYNAFPGSQLRVMVREMMQYHARDRSVPSERLAAAKAMLESLRLSWPEPDDLRHWVGKEAAATLQRSRDTLYHDEMNEEYRPAYFHQFVAHAARHRLQYLGETEFHDMNETGLSPEGREQLRKIGPDRILEREQYMDFLKCRSFRQTLLCREEIELRREISLEVVERFHIGTRALPQRRDPSPGERIEYRSPKGGSMTTADPVLQRIMGRMEAAWPRGLPFPELHAGEIDPAALAGVVMQMYAADVVELRLRPGSFSMTPAERPEASRYARLQLEQEQEQEVTNLRHVGVRLEDPGIRTLLRLLDGTRDRQALLRDFSAAGFSIEPDALESLLGQFARSALLLA